MEKLKLFFLMQRDTHREVFKLNSLEKRMSKILDIRKSLDLEDDFGIKVCWEKITNQLSVDEKETIRYLTKCKKEELYWISEVFEDISLKLQSREYIKCLREIEKKFPDLEMTRDIDIAESYMD